MKIISRVALVVAMLPGGAALVSQPASAHTSVCVGAGTMNTPNLGYPITVSPPTFLTPSVGGFTFTLGYPSNGGCTTPSINSLGPLIATGVLEGYCLHWTGGGTLSDNGDTHLFTQTSAGSVIVVTATLGGGVLNAVPLPSVGGGNSCLNRTANQFAVTGAVVLLQP